MMVKYRYFYEKKWLLLTVVIILSTIEMFKRQATLTDANANDATWSIITPSLALVLAWKPQNLQIFLRKWNFGSVETNLRRIVWSVFLFQTIWHLVNFLLLKLIKILRLELIQYLIDPPASEASREVANIFIWFGVDFINCHGPYRALRPTFTPQNSFSNVGHRCRAQMDRAILKYWRDKSNFWIKGKLTNYTV